ncbi:MAG: hypothetical protein B7Y74_12280, partial [Novosphingobium sp. 35-62-5]
GFQIDKFEALRIFDPPAHNEMQLLHWQLSFGEDSYVPLTKSAALRKSRNVVFGGESGLNAALSISA